MKIVIFVFAAMVFCISSPAFAQQRVIVEKATGNVVDVGDSTLQYDTRYFDNLGEKTGLGAYFPSVNIARASTYH